MRVKVPFLAHYHGNTRQRPASKENVAWAETEVDLPVIRRRDMELVFVDGEGDRVRLDQDRAYAFDGFYWATPEACCAESHWGLHDWRGDWRRKKSGLRNFDADRMQDFAVRAFEFRFFDRLPSSVVYSRTTSNYTAYRPGNEIEWDDTPIIEGRVRDYYLRNMVVAEDTVYCRIEPPVLGEAKPPYGKRPAWHRRIFTPLGGQGDPVIDFEAAYAKALTIASVPESQSADPDRQPFFKPIDGYPVDNAKRTVQALFGALFGMHPWLKRHPWSKKSAKDEFLASLEGLRKLWLASYSNLTDETADAAAEAMLALADAHEDVRTILEAWLDRPISL